MPSGAKKRKAARRKKEMEMGLPHQPPLSPTTIPHGNGHERESASEEESDAARAMDRSENGAGADDVVEVVKEVEEGKKGSSSSSSSSSSSASASAAAAPEVLLSKEEVPSSSAAAMEMLLSEEEVPSSSAAALEIPFLREEVPSSSSALEIPLSKEELPSSSSALEMPLSKEEVPVFKEGGEVSVECVKVEDKVEETPNPELVNVPVVQVDAVNEEVAEVIEAQAEEASAALAQAIQERGVTVVVSEKGPESVESFPEVRSREIAGTSLEEVASAPLAVHRATWWNCCGLLDVFSDSQR